MKKILITGGAGFIGAHVVSKLLKMGHSVHVLDSFHNYIFPIEATYLENMNYRFNVLLKGAQIIRGNTKNPDSFRRVVGEINPDYIIHLAALPLANIALRDSNEAFDGIISGTTNLLEILRDHGKIEKLLYISSSMIYGDFAQDSMTEDVIADPKEIYGGMKLCGEILVKVYSRRYDIPYCLVRPSAVYGPTDNNRRVLQIFVENAIQGKPIVVTDPNQTFLDFSFVEDVADGMIAAVMSPRSTGETFNITYGQGRSLGEVVEILGRYFPDLIVQEKMEAESFRPKRGSLDVKKAKELIGYQPKYSLEKGLDLYINYIYENNPSILDGSKSNSSGGHVPVD